MNFGLKVKFTARQNQVVDFLKELRGCIILNFETLESNKKFHYSPWNYKHEGGGEIGLLRGDLFEKAAVNWSGIAGEQFPMADGSGPFFATGISLITHMFNPHAPTVHFNLRYLETANQTWFGGGYDLTPMGFAYAEDTFHFHETTRKALDQIEQGLYEKFSQNAREYFYIPHRKKERGVGGIFFDHYNTGNFDADLSLLKLIGQTFLEAILPIYRLRIHHPFSHEDKKIQLKYRAHYVEFNLLYDRGTKFGFLSGGNPEAILCSMPPCATW